MGYLATRSASKTHFQTGFQSLKGYLTLFCHVELRPKSRGVGSGPASSPTRAATHSCHATFSNQRDILIRAAEMEPSKGAPREFGETSFSQLASGPL